jgi:hypothetical protein
MTSIDDFRTFLATKTCTHDNASLKNGKVAYYRHEGGIDIDGKGKVWLYVECPKCGYGWSFKKLGFV